MANQEQISTPLTRLTRMLADATAMLAATTQKSINEAAQFHEMLAKSAEAFEKMKADFDAAVELRNAAQQELATLKAANKRSDAANTGIAHVILNTDLSKLSGSVQDTLTEWAEEFVAEQLKKGD